MALARKKAVFIAATGQNVGKTTISLGLVFALQKHFSSVGFCKPVGQEYAKTPSSQIVDKDVLLFRSHFSLSSSYADMSPVVFPPGFTRDYLDGKVSRDSLLASIQKSYQTIQDAHACTVVEGTGHTAVGSIVDLNNAQVAHLLHLPVLLVAKGGLGSSFDALMLNYTQCEKYGAKVAGVILNRVLPEKREMVLSYMQKALDRYNIPILGAIPYDPFLSTPTLQDFLQLFQTELLSGKEQRLVHIEEIRWISSSLEVFASQHIHQELLLIPAEREDLLFALLARKWSLQERAKAPALLLTGKTPPSDSLLEKLEKHQMAAFYTPLAGWTALQKIHDMPMKIRQEDTEKIEEAIRVVEKHLFLDRLLHSL